MAQFTSSGGGGVPVSISTGGEIVSYSVVNVSVPISNTEVEIVIPTTAVWFQLLNRTDGLTRVSYNSGESSTLYSTVSPGGVQEYSKKSGTALSLYVQCPKGSQVIEVTYGHST